MPTDDQPVSSEAEATPEYHEAQAMLLLRRYGSGAAPAPENVARAQAHATLALAMRSAEATDVALAGAVVETCEHTDESWSGTELLVMPPGHEPTPLWRCDACSALLYYLDGENRSVVL